jgi:hypothetical protein
MIVLTKDEWKERVASNTRKMGKRIAILFVVLYIGLSFFLLMIWLQDPLTRVFGAYFMLMIAALLIISWGFSYAMVRWQLRNYPQMGLYEKGVQFTPMIFLPYHEVASMKDYGLKLYPGPPKAVRIELRTKPSIMATFIMPTPVLIYKSLLGEEGLDEMDRRIRGIVPQQGPPELRIYGPSAPR